MNTSYYSKYGNGFNAVGISAKVPDFYTGRRIKCLAPSWSIFKEYKLTGDEELYTRRFRDEILATLDPMEIYNLLTPEAVLLCYEGKAKFCHRHLVAEWLVGSIPGLVINEL